MSAPLVKNPRLVAAPLRRCSGKWLRYCPAWFMTGSPAGWTTSEPRLRAQQAGGAA